ncbi:MULTISPECIES: hypothetical protein [unclassified Acinetobacter]|uniref:hypothetical protein n=1 Tax=unclassified Acinetobacter TaxID=196816 RepID=UPI00190E14FE|nr:MULTISPECIES: hypothetical protein [unclassified Acinetobacter]MBK0064564.1 hypothetical protein [Acinetobacter sp. S55]MBK0067889.1 hypothetical protein [Acinetobacter sp. S54]
MELDQIWKQQLSLVTYGNEYLSHDLSFNRWLQHSIFYQHYFQFRDLHSQHLLAQHFQIWLEGLKKQGVYRISLHLSTLLSDEQNPNANVELLPFTHFIVSHEKNKKTAWILGKELAEWYLNENDFEIPASQQATLHEETFWRFDLSDKLSKKIETDLKESDWDEIQTFIENELFRSKYTHDFIEPQNRDLPYYGIDAKLVHKPDGSPLQDMQYLALIPTDYSADVAHELLHRTQALSDFIDQLRQHPYRESGEMLTPEDQINLRNFSQKMDDLNAKLIVKIANHYKSAQRAPVEIASPLDPHVQTTLQSKKSSAPHHHQTHKVGSSGVIKLIILTIIICACAYYFGL